jgi:hypothetical protein
MSIRSLMSFVVVSAVAVAALRNADDYWASGMILTTPMLFGVALIGALCGRERSQARTLGFAILGGGYFALAFMGLSRPHVERLPTSQFLTYIHQQVAPAPTATSTVKGTVSVSVRGRSAPPIVRPDPLYLVTSSPAKVVATVGAVSTGRWKALLPGAANYEAFGIVGHCLFALVAGLLGGTVAVWFHARRERVAADVPTPRPETPQV